MTAGTAALRRVEVRPLSARVELWNILRVAMGIVIAAAMYLSTDSALFGGPSDGARQLLPFQQLIQGRPPVEQRMFRELQEGLLEAEVRRSTDNTWPGVDALADEGIPPFAFDPTRDVAYDWSLERDGAFVNYLGVPDDPEAPAWMLLIQEPVPGAPPDTAREDEEHHRLLDGSMLHVSTWVRDTGHVSRRIVRTPQGEGWTQLYAVGPSTAHSAMAPPN